MSKVNLRKNNRERRKLRVRKKIFGEAVCPRVTIFRSNKYVYAQIVDDRVSKTLIGISLNEVKKLHDGNNKTDAAFKVGEEVAKKATAKKISKVIFDRNGYRYHGRVKSLTEGLRKGGLIL